MTESSHVALKLSELIRNHFQGVTKQKKIVELLKAQGVEVSEGLLSRLFNGFYEVRLDSRLFAELSQLLAPEESKEAFWDRLLKDYNPNTALNESIKIGLSLKSFWARPFVTMLINKSLPEPFEIVYGQRVQKRFDENYEVTERKHIGYLTAKSLSIPHTGVSLDNTRSQYPKNVFTPTNHLYDLLEREKDKAKVLAEHVYENNEWLLSESLIELLQTNQLQIIAAPESGKVSQYSDIIPLCRITAGYVSQMLIFEGVENSTNQPSNTDGNLTDKDNENEGTESRNDGLASPLFSRIDNLIKKQSKTESPNNPSVFSKEDIEFLKKYLPILEGIKEKKLAVKTYNIQDREQKKEYKVSVNYNPFLPDEMDLERAKDNYLNHIAECISVKENSAFWVRTIQNTLSADLLADFINLLKTKAEQSALAVKQLTRYSLQENQENNSSAYLKYKEEEQKRWQSLYTLFSTRISKQLSMYSERFIYKKQVKDRIVKDILCRGGTFVLIGFVPFADKVLWDIVKYFNRESKDYTLKINRFNLSNLLDKRITTNLYARKDYLKQLIRENRLLVLDKLIDGLSESVNQFKKNDVLKRQLAFHHFYFEDLDRDDELSRMSETFHKKTALMEAYINEYDSSERINEFSYKIVRTDEYARFLEEMLSEK